MTATISKTILNFPTPVAGHESMAHAGADGPEMSNRPMAHERSLRERAETEKFLETPGEDSFADLFKTFTPQLVAFFRARRCDLALSEDLAQEVMCSVCRK